MALRASVSSFRMCCSHLRFRFVPAFHLNEVGLDTKQWRGLFDSKDEDVSGWFPHLE